MSAGELNIQQYKKMTETPIPKLILGLAAPTILSMLITSISGAWLYTGPRLRHHHQPQPWQPEH